MVSEYGLWSDASGGIVAAQMYSRDEAEGEKERLEKEDPDNDDLEVVEMCPDHSEEARDQCEECN